MARRITHGFVVDEEVELCGGEGPGGGAHHVDRLVQRVLGLQALDLRRSLGPDCKGKKRLIGLFVVGRNLFLLLLNCSSWPCPESCLTRYRRQTLFFSLPYVKKRILRLKIHRIFDNAKLSILRVFSRIEIFGHGWLNSFNLCITLFLGF